MSRFDEQTTEYREMLEEILSLFIKKGKDYGTEDDHYQNLRAGEAWGVPAWVGAYIRLCDKIKRLQKYFKDGKLENESVEDSLRDVIVYAGNAYMLWKEKQVLNQAKETINPSLNMVANYKGFTVTGEQL